MIGLAYCKNIQLGCVLSVHHEVKVSHSGYTYEIIDICVNFSILLCLLI